MQTKSQRSGSGPRRSTISRTVKPKFTQKPRFQKRGASSRPKSSGGKRFSSAGHSAGRGRGRSGGGGGRRRKMPTFDPSQFINKNPVNAAPDVYETKHTFATFGLNEKLVHTIHAMDITEPSPIQDQIIPEIMLGKDVIGLAETGTGKTAAFLVPLLDKTIQDDNQCTIILTPTRELAIQIQDEFRKLSNGFRLFSTTCVGGVPLRPQIKSLERKNHFIIGTPGRVLDLIKRGVLPTEKITNVVLDEADRMLDMGFIHDMKNILKTIPANHQTLFFSATMSDATKQLVTEFLNEPVMISVKKKDVTNSIEQDVVRFEDAHKLTTLTTMLNKKEDMPRVIIFCEMKFGVKRLEEDLVKAGIKSASIHGNKSQSQRQRALKQFKTGNAQVLVATDVAARGIHVDDVSHVINYDLPQTFDDYVHRIGRTGRGTKRGKALTFVPTR